MIDLKTITMRIIGGDLDGIRICRVEGESLFMVAIPHNKVTEANRLPEIPRQCLCWPAIRTAGSSGWMTRQ